MSARLLVSRLVKHPVPLGIRAARRLSSLCVYSVLVSSECIAAYLMIKEWKGVAE